MHWRFYHYHNFNPRTRKGCDMPSPLGAVCRCPYFNPRTRKGCDYLQSDGVINHFLNLFPRTPILISYFFLISKCRMFLSLIQYVVQEV